MMAYQANILCNNRNEDDRMIGLVLRRLLENPYLENFEYFGHSGSTLIFEKFSEEAANFNLGYVQGVFYLEIVYKDTCITHGFTDQGHTLETALEKFEQELVHCFQK